MPIEPVILFFLLGLIAGVARSDLKIPAILYESLSIFLLLAIGLKGGIELARYPLLSLAGQAAVVLAAAALIPLVAFAALYRLGRLPRADAAAIAAHYGSVSVVTFAVAASFLSRHEIDYEGYLVVFLALLEIPALLIGVLLAKRRDDAPWGAMLHEVLSGKSIVLLVGGLLIGWFAGPEGIQPLDRLFLDLFKGVLAIFLLEMGLVVASRLGDLRQAGAFLIGFGIAMPLAGAALGLAVAHFLQFSLGGTVLLAVLFASASYIAAPAAMRIAIPEANPALSIGASLGITFPFNLLIGIPLYHQIAARLA